MAEKKEVLKQGWCLMRVVLLSDQGGVAVWSGWCCCLIRVVLLSDEAGVAVWWRWPLSSINMYTKGACLLLSIWASRGTAMLVHSLAIQSRQSLAHDVYDTFAPPAGLFLTSLTHSAGQDTSYKTTLLIHWGNCMVCHEMCYVRKHCINNACSHSSKLHSTRTNSSCLPFTAKQSSILPQPHRPTNWHIQGHVFVTVECWFLTNRMRNHYFYSFCGYGLCHFSLVPQ